MVATASRMRQLGTEMPAFALRDTLSDQIVDSLSLREAPAVVIAFICNHCPYVIHIQPALTEFGHWCLAQGVPLVAISSNDAVAYPQDGPAIMALEGRRAAYPFPYLFDETQAVARAFDAACTPDFFVFDGSGKLAYRGQFDDSRPGNEVASTGADVRAAVQAILQGRAPAERQKPSLGCSLKWKAPGPPSGNVKRPAPRA